MSNELIEVQEKTILASFSDENGLDAIVNQARELVAGFEHDLSTDAGRKRTASLAAKVAKLKTRLDGLGKSLTEDWAKKKKAVDANRKAMRDALDELKVEARKPLDDWEKEQIEKALQKKREEEAKQREADHEFALLMNEKIDAERAAQLEADRKAEEERQKQLKAEQEAREKQIAEEAAAMARQEAAQREAAAKAEAEAAKQRAIEAEARRKIEAEQAEARRIEAEKQAKIQAEQAAENARKAEIARQEAEAKRLADEQAKREANKKHIGKIRGAAKECLMAKGLDEETAKMVVLAIHNGEIANVSIKY